MNIPAASIENCVYCTGLSHTYDENCRECFIRSIAHLPIKHRGAMYTRITFKHGTTVMTKISDEVAAWYQAHRSGVFT